MYYTPNKTKKKVYKCSYCGKAFPTQLRADSCRDSHDLIYVQLSRADVDKLIKFIYFKDDSLISPKLIEQLKRYTRKITQNGRKWVKYGIIKVDNKIKQQKIGKGLNEKEGKFTQLTAIQGND